MAKLKLLICSTKANDAYATSIANHLCSIAYNSLKLDTLASRSPLRIIETTINGQQIDFWHLVDSGQTANGLPAICTLSLDGLILVSNESIVDFLNSNSLLFSRKNRPPILWFHSKQLDLAVLGNIQQQQNIKQVNSLNLSLDAVQNEFNNWLAQLRSPINDNAFSNYGTNYY